MTTMTALFLCRLKTPLLFLTAVLAVAPAAPLPAAEILTPPAPATPRINGAKIFGVRPGSPFLFTIPATGDRPMKFSADHLPRGLKLDARTGRITGKLKKPGEFNVTLRAKNKLGAAEEKFRIVCGDTIALTPPMGWNSWNCFAGAVSADKVKRAAAALVKSGLAKHGWTYINIDDYWQNHRNSKDPTLRGPFRDARGTSCPIAVPRHERPGRLHPRHGSEGGALFLARPVDLRWLRGKLAARGTGRENLRRLGL